MNKKSRPEKDPRRKEFKRGDRDQKPREFKPRSKDFKPREFKPREGGFKRDDRDQKPREFKPRDKDFKPREFKPREGGFKRDDRDKKPREFKPWDKDSKPRGFKRDDSDQSPREFKPRDKEFTPKEFDGEEREQRPIKDLKHLEKDLKQKELKYYGVHACLFLFKYRSEDIIRVYIEEELVPKFKSVLKWCAENKKAYHLVESTDLDKLTDSIHHEGVCILARELPAFEEKELFKVTEKKSCFLFLDGVQNPHNLGSIARTAAHFGVTHILGEKGKMSLLAPSACRVAKGGAELVKIVLLENPLKALKDLKDKGYALIGTSSHEGNSLYSFSFPDKTIIIMGAETEGISKAMFAILSDKVRIPGTNVLDSLNVSVATSLCLSEYFRQHKEV